jgi:hypothetical protein
MERTPSTVANEAIMVKSKKKTEMLATTADTSEKVIDLGELLSTKATYQKFKIWIIGYTPLITHAWSEKAKREMLSKQVKATKGGKAARDPHEDFVTSLYEMGTEGKKTIYGFPITGIKNAILSSAHKDKGVARSTVQSALWLDADMVRVRPALASAICDMPLVRIYGSAPEMREDMVRIGKGLNKTANLAYRGQFTTWAMSITGKFNATVLSAQALSFLIMEAGTGTGIGEWRNEKKGIFGSFRLANSTERKEWEKFAAGKGPLPVPQHDDYDIVELEAAE